MSDKTIPYNPFITESGNDDNELVTAAVAGDKAAMEDLLKRHQPWIYNVAFRMVMVPQDVEDVTQEILIKVITKLSTFDPSKASFRTWLYRIVVNHIINMKKCGYELAISQIENYYSFVNLVSDHEPDNSPELQLVVEDIKIGCVMGVMLCLERDQRLAFILAVGFNVTDAVGSEILDISKSAFRKLLSRARNKLHSYIYGNCSLMNPDAPCHCNKKVRGFMQGGGYGPDKLHFIKPNALTISSIVDSCAGRFSEDIYTDYIRLVRNHPFYPAPEVTEWLRGMITRPEFNKIFDIESYQ